MTEKITINSGKVVKVVWYDAILNKDSASELPEVTDVGYIIKELETPLPSIVIAFEKVKNVPNVPAYYRHYLTVPKSCIKEIKQLEVGD